MHIGKCVPMIALCLLLCGCKEQVEETDIRAAYREMSGCELTMKVVCGEAQREWVATLQCHYAPEGESTVEVTEPLELAGVRAVLREADWSLEYSDLCLNIGPLSAEQISPPRCRYGCSMLCGRGGCWRKTPRSGRISPASGWRWSRPAAAAGTL